MITRKVIQLLVAGAVMVAAAGVVVVSAAFALYTLLRDYLGPAGASAVIAALFAVIFGLVGLIALRRGASKTAKTAKTKVAKRDSTAMGRVVDALRDRPIVAAGAAAAAGLIAWRNPQLVSLVLRALEPRADHGRD